MADQNHDHQVIIYEMSFQKMCMSLRILAVMVLGCFLVSAVSAVDGCSYCNAAPPGGWGAPSTDKYWGMSADEIRAAGGSTDTSESGESDSWRPPAVVLPSFSGDKFASLNDLISKYGKSTSLPGTYSGTFSDRMTKPSYHDTAETGTSALIKTDMTPKSDLGVKSIFTKSGTLFF
jgi:hypothetical protein